MTERSSVIIMRAIKSRVLQHTSICLLFSFLLNTISWDYKMCYGIKTVDWNSKMLRDFIYFRFIRNDLSGNEFNQSYNSVKKFHLIAFRMIKNDRSEHYLKTKISVFSVQKHVLVSIKFVILFVHNGNTQNWMIQLMMRVYISDKLGLLVSALIWMYLYGCIES